MAAAIINRTSLLTRLKLELNDTDTSDQWLTDDQYNERIYKHIVGDSNIYVVQVRAPGSTSLPRVYTWRGTQLWLFGATFTGIDDATYNLRPEGTIEEITSGAKLDTRSTIDITGTTVNFPELIVDVIQTLMTHKAQKESVNLGSAGFSPQDEERLSRIAQTWRGFVAV